MDDIESITPPSSTFPNPLSNPFYPPYTLESELWWEYPASLDSRSYEFSEMGWSSHSSYGSISVDPRLLTRSIETPGAGPIVEVLEDSFGSVKGGNEIADENLFTEELSILRFFKGDNCDSGQVEMMNEITKYDDWSNDQSGRFYSAGSRPVSTTSTQRETMINPTSTELVPFTPPQSWSPHENPTVNPSFVLSPSSPSPLSTRHIITSSSQDTELTTTDFLNDDSLETPNTSNDCFDREGSLSSVPSDFEQRTPILKVFDSITVISTPSPLPSPIIETPGQLLNRTRIIDVPQPRLGRRRGQKYKGKGDIQPRRSSRIRYKEHPSEKQEKELVVGPLTKDEFDRVYEMKNSSRYYTWRDIGGELNRDWREIRRLKELSEEYDRAKWGFIAKVLEIDEEKCVSQARELQLC